MKRIRDHYCPTCDADVTVVIQTVNNYEYGICSVCGAQLYTQKLMKEMLDDCREQTDQD